jgi:hypothetical protein
LCRLGHALAPLISKCREPLEALTEVYVLSSSFLIGTESIMGQALPSLIYERLGASFVCKLPQSVAQQALQTNFSCLRDHSDFRIDCLCDLQSVFGQIHY